MKIIRENGIFDEKNYTNFEENEDLVQKTLAELVSKNIIYKVRTIFSQEEF